MPSLITEGRGGCGRFGGIPPQRGESETSHRTHPPSTAQQKISNFLYAEDSLGGAIPERFLEFCRHSIESVRGSLLYTEPIIPSIDGSTEYDGAEAEMYTLNLPHHDLHRDQLQLIHLSPVASNRPVAAVDTSTIKLGELSDGALCAVRGAIVLLENKSYRYVRYGPLVFSIGYNTPATSQDFANLGLPPFSGEANVDSLLKRVRNVLERWLQFNVSSSIADGFILLDGSLTAGTPDNPSKDLERILETGRRGGSTVIAVSKKTKLRINNHSLTELLENESEPCILDVDEQVTEQFPPYPVRFLGRVFVGKLARSGFPFRIDVDREVPMPETVNGFRELAGTDIVDQGYPETLRMAHILATFTASDVLAMQAFAAARFGVQILPKLALRRSLFGPFGTAWEALH